MVGWMLRVVTFRWVQFGVSSTTAWHRRYPVAVAAARMASISFFKMSVVLWMSEGWAVWSQ